jgi:hypothetical protein
MQIGRKNHDIPMPIIQLFFALSLLVNFGLILVDRKFFFCQYIYNSLTHFFLQIFIFNTMDFY